MINTRKDTVLQLFSCLMALSFIGNSIPLLCNESCAIAPQQFEVELPKKEETASRKKRMRKSKAEKKGKKPKRLGTYLDMEYEDLVVAKNAHRKKNNISATVKYLEQLLKICTNITAIADHLLELADVLYLDKQFEKAGQVYTQFCTLYPGNEKQEYALYRSIECSFSCILSFDRDQTKTEETVALTELFLIQDHFTTYRAEVINIQEQCYRQLAASECNVCSFYLNRGKLNAAEKRLKKIRSYWLPKLPTLEPEIITLEASLNEEKELQQLLNTKNLVLAQNKNSHMANRF